MQKVAVTYIPMPKTLDRHVYKLRSRNLSIGVYGAKLRVFIGIRTKFGDRYLATEFHWDTGPPHGTAMPVEELGQLPDEIEVNYSDKLFKFLDALRIEQ